MLFKKRKKKKEEGFLSVIYMRKSTEFFLEDYGWLENRWDYHPSSV